MEKILIGLGIYAGLSTFISILFFKSKKRKEQHFVVNEVPSSPSKRKKYDENSLVPAIYEGHKFDYFQMEEIKKGLERNLDVSCYAKEEFNYKQMEQIRIGLEQSLNVFIYANPQYNWQQMREIRLGLKKGLNVVVYSDPQNSWQQMRKIRIELERKSNKTVNVDEISNKKVSSFSHKKVDFSEIEPYHIELFDLCFKHSINISVDTIKQFNEEQVKQIKLGIEEGLDVIVYAEPDIDAKQMEEIRKKMKQG